MKKTVMLIMVCCLLLPLAALAEGETPPRVIAQPASEETGQRYIRVELDYELAEKALRGLVLAVSDSPEQPQFWEEFTETIELRQEGTWFIHYIIADKGRGYREGVFGPYIIRYGLPEGYQPPLRLVPPPRQESWQERLQRLGLRIFYTFVALMGFGEH